MPRGGARPGAGRRSKVVREKQTAAIVEVLTNQDEMTPLQVMIHAMRLHVKNEQWKDAVAIAKEAAPYVHPKLASVEQKLDAEGPVQFVFVSTDQHV
jgi:hypothetical protein